jgi:hypothetical protein
MSNDKRTIEQETAALAARSGRAASAHAEALPQLWV